jgi:hypothetical protein
MKKIKEIFMITSLALIFSQNSIAQQKTIIPDLSKIVNGDGWSVVNREARIIDVDGQKCIYFNAPNKQGGVAWLEGVDFKNGTIEVDIKGRNVRGGSFLGIAFRGLNDTTYDAVYFRPFNFPLPDQGGHSVQYISHPQHTWYTLRKEHPGQYENSVIPAPDPEKLFHVQIVIAKPRVSVYVNNSKKPCLVVDELSERTGGRIGLWMDFISDGTFANLKISPVKE